MCIFNILIKSNVIFVVVFKSVFVNSFCPGALPHPMGLPVAAELFTPYSRAVTASQVCSLWSLEVEDRAVIWVSWGGGLGKKVVHSLEAWTDSKPSSLDHCLSG